MIARALMADPELLVADESTSMLDASLRVTVLNVLLYLRKRHTLISDVPLLRGRESIMTQ